MKSRKRNMGKGIIGPGGGDSGLRQGGVKVGTFAFRKKFLGRPRRE